jgi:hypothetical protein
VVVAEAERCAWCGRTGARRECEAWDGSSIRYRDPVLCDVCVHLWSVPGAVHDVWYEYGVDYDSVIEGGRDRDRTVVPTTHGRRPRDLAAGRLSPRQAAPKVDQAKCGCAGRRCAHLRRPALTAVHRETARMLRRSGTDVARPLRPEACPSEHRRHRTDRTAGRSHIANGGDPRRGEPAARWTRGCHRESVRRESVPVLDVRQQNDLGRH